VPVPVDALAQASLADELEGTTELLLGGGRTTLEELSIADELDQADELDRTDELLLRTDELDRVDELLLLEETLDELGNDDELERATELLLGGRALLLDSLIEELLLIMRQYMPGMFAPINSAVHSQFHCSNSPNSPYIRIFIIPISQVLFEPP